ncbi:MAG: exopolyphosphatase [Spirochaetaceae bacterium]|jgi:nanoRNase/pAp phosphatase (c-di-AMP/oligoRNAs hydrolase)|nr:exopolyphosphatase [Spirochaetaceae bacterium]
MRLVTRADFDGLACSALLDHIGIIDLWEFVHPTDVQNNKVKVTGDDIIANLPFVKGCKIWFDHHTSETGRLGREFFEESEPVMAAKYAAAFVPALGAVTREAGEAAEYHTLKVSYAAPSCARVVADYYTKQGYNLEQFAEMLRFVDKVDSGDLSASELAAPSGWVLFGLIMDPRTQLERAKKYTVGIKELTEKLSTAMQKLTIDELLALPDVRERVEVYESQMERFTETARRCCRVDANVIVMDMRGVKEIPIGNRFALYTLYPEQNISVTVMDGRAKDSVAIAVGYSVINRTAAIDVGALLLQYGGGGHKQVGSCSAAKKDAERVIAEIIRACRKESA